MPEIANIDDASQAIEAIRDALNDTDLYLEDGEFKEASELIEDQIEALQALKVWVDEQPGK